MVVVVRKGAYQEDLDSAIELRFFEEFDQQTRWECLVQKIFSEEIFLRFNAFLFEGSPPLFEEGAFDQKVGYTDCNMAAVAMNRRCIVEVVFVGEIAGSQPKPCNFHVFFS